MNPVQTIRIHSVARCKANLPLLQSDLLRAPSAAAPDQACNRVQPSGRGCLATSCRELRYCSGQRHEITHRKVSHRSAH